MTSTIKKMDLEPAMKVVDVFVGSLDYSGEKHFYTDVDVVDNVYVPVGVVGWYTQNLGTTNFICFANYMRNSSVTTSTRLGTKNAAASLYIQVLYLKAVSQ